jgi:hypothetical protein
VNIHLPLCLGIILLGICGGAELGEPANSRADAALEYGCDKVEPDVVRSALRAGARPGSPFPSGETPLNTVLKRRIQFHNEEVQADALAIAEDLIRAGVHPSIWRIRKA